MLFERIFAAKKPVIGMLHLAALPGAPAGCLALEEIARLALADAEALAEGGVDGLIVENYGDAPFYPGRVPPHTVASMTAVAREVRRRFALPLGINVLRNDGMSALAIAAAAGAAFIRVNVYTGARLTDQGIIQGQAHRLLRYRKMLGSEAAVFADVAVKHSAPLGPRALGDEVEDALERGKADAVIVTGQATGKPAGVEDIREAKRAAGLAPVLVGSGVTAETVAAVLDIADGVIVGTALKKDSATTNPVDPARVREFMRAVPR